MKKQPAEALKVIEDVVQNYADWSLDERNASRKGRYEINAINILNSKLVALSSKFDKLQYPIFSTSPIQNSHASSFSNDNMSMQMMYCDICGCDDHSPSKCCLLMNDSCSPFPSMEQVNAINGQTNPRNDPYSNTYNEGWKHHPNFGWRGGQVQGNGNGQSSGQRNFQNNVQGNLRNQGNGNYMSNNQSNNQNDNRYHQRGQYSSNNNPPDFNGGNKPTLAPIPQPPLQIQAPPPKSSLEITMEKFVNAQNKKINDLEEGLKQMQTHNKMLENQLTQLVNALKSNNSSTSLASQAIDPREHCNAIITRCGETYEETLPMEIEEKVEREEASEEKECEVSKLSVEERVNLTETCNAIIVDHSPTKLKDPGSFSIPCSIENVVFENALCDLGASVSLMPLSVYEKLDIGGLVPTNVTLQLADSSIKFPRGKVEDVPLKVGNSTIPVDFIVMEMTEDILTPIILGRPFLATGGAIIDVREGKLTLNVGDDKFCLTPGPIKECPLPTSDCIKLNELVDDVVHKLIIPFTTNPFVDVDEPKKELDRFDEVISILSHLNTTFKMEEVKPCKEEVVGTKSPKKKKKGKSRRRRKKKVSSNEVLNKIAPFEMEENVQALPMKAFCNRGNNEKIVVSNFAPP